MISPDGHIYKVFGETANFYKDKEVLLDKQQALLGAAICEAAGLLCMLVVNRLMPIPFDLITTGVGFLLLVFGPFVYFLGRDNKRY